MKQVIISSLTLFAGLFCFSETTHTNYKEHYKDHWIQTDWYSNKYDKSEFKMYQKNNTAITDVINSTLTITKNNAEKKSVVLNLFKKSTRIPENKWFIENIDGLEIYEGLSVSDGAVYRIAFNSRNSEFSTSTIKIRYLLPTYLEAHLLQVELLNGRVENKKVKVQFLIRWFLAKLFIFQ